VNTHYIYLSCRFRRGVDDELKQLRDALDQPEFHRPLHHDEHGGEEQQRVPLNHLNHRMDLFGVHDDDKDRRPNQRHPARIEACDLLEQKADDDAACHIN